MANLYSQLRGACWPDPEKAFVTGPTGTMTYGELEAGSARYAGALREIGVSVGDRVAVQVQKSMDMILLYLGCLRAGAVFLPLNIGYTNAEVAFFIEDAEPALMVCDDDRIDTIREALGKRVKRVESIDGAGGGSLANLAARQSPAFETVERDDDALAAILYTSGTTGRSKGAMLSHANLASNTFVLRDTWRFTADDVLVHALPIFHTHGLFVAINVAIAAGATLYFLSAFDVDEVLKGFDHATVLMGVPTFYVRLLADARLDRDRAARMRLFISGSAPLPAEVHREWAARTGHDILERYGLTETGINTSNPHDGERRPGSVGQALPGVKVRIVDDASGEMLVPGDIGAIEVSGPNVFKGYWRMPEKTAAEFRDGYFMTGDLGTIDNNGYVTIMSRAKDLILVGGLNVYPAEVEGVIGAFEDIEDVTVIGVPHPDLGEGVVAILVPRGRQHLDPADITDRLSGRLARFKQPRRYVFVDALPRNAMGKVQKAALRAAYAHLFELTVDSRRS